VKDLPKKTSPFREMANIMKRHRIPRNIAKRIKSIQAIEESSKAANQKIVEFEANRIQRELRKEKTQEEILEILRQSYQN